LDHLLEVLENIITLGESMAILAVAREHGAGELPPEYFQRLAHMIISHCQDAKARINNLTI
jgi:hypothetical protein